MKITINSMVRLQSGDIYAHVSQQLPSGYVQSGSIIIDGNTRDQVGQFFDQVVVDAVLSKV